MPIDIELEEQLSDIVNGDSYNCNQWIKHPKHSKEKLFNGIILEVEPKDATTIEEVKRFKASIDMTVMEEIIFERKE